MTERQEPQKWQNAVGWLGALFVVAAYAFLTFGVVTAESLVYNAMNFCGGVALCYRVWLDRNYSNVFLEIVFIAVAVYAVVRGLSG